MKSKLLHAQNVLEGIALEDYQAIEKNSQELGNLSRAATWQVFNTEEYRKLSVEFENSTHILSKAAKEKNLDAAALAYVGMTLSCVNCHSYVRQVRDAR